MVPGAAATAGGEVSGVMVVVEERVPEGGCTWDVGGGGGECQ